MGQERPEQKIEAFAGQDEHTEQILHDDGAALHVPADLVDDETEEQ